MVVELGDVRVITHGDGGGAGGIKYRVRVRDCRGDSLPMTIEEFEEGAEVVR
jgi:hypothetical protein